MIKKLQINLNPKDAGYYPADDLPAHIQTLKEKSKIQPRPRRTDLQKGQIVIVLQGEYTAMRVVFLKQLKDNFALCSGPSSINNVPFFKIDERFLLRTSTVLNLKGEIKIDDALNTLEENKMEVEMNDEERRIEREIVGEVEKIKFMRRYLCTPFSVPEGVDFYSINL